MENLIQIISEFDTISLSQMDGVKLMNRTDTKFTFSCLKLNELLKNIKPFYNILDIKGQLIQDYKSLYYDTEDRKFYIDHTIGELIEIKLDLDSMLKRFNIFRDKT